MMQEKLHNSISHAATFQESTTFHIFIYLKTPGMDYGCSLFYLSYLRQMWDFNGSECSDMKIWCHLSYHWVFFWESHFPTTNFWGLQSDKGSVHSGNSCMYFQLLLLCRKGFVCLCLLTWQKLNFQDSRGGCLQTCIKDRDGKWPLCYDMGWFDESLFGVCVWLWWTHGTIPCPYGYHQPAYGSNSPFSSFDRNLLFPSLTASVLERILYYF